MIFGTVLGVGAVGLFVRPSLWRAERPSRELSLAPADLQPPVVPEWTVPELPPVSDAAFDDLRHEAVEVVGRLVRAFPDNPHATTVAGLLHNRFGNTAEAVECWERSLQLDPGFAPAYHGMGTVALKSGDYEEAEALLRRALELDPTLADAAVDLANALIRMGRAEEAVAPLVRHTRTSFGTSRRVLYSLGHVYLQLHEYEKAKTHYRAAIEVDPAWTRAYYGLSKACARLGETEQSEAYLEKFKELIDHDLAADIERSRSYDDLASARRIVAYVYTAAGRVYQACSNVREAEVHWLRAAELNPKDTACREELARLYIEGHRVEEALGALENLAEIEPRNSAYHMNIGLVNAMSSRFDAAEKAFNRVRELSPRRPEGYLALVRLYLEANRKLPQAVKLAGVAVEIEPSAGNYAVLSEACERNGDFDGALSAIERAMELDRGNRQYRRLREALLARQ